MIESKVYKCEICGTVYNEKEKCRQCEAFHARLHGASDPFITNPRYLSMNNSRNPFPDKITVLFDNGRKAQYEYKGEVRTR